MKNNDTIKRQLTEAEKIIKGLSGTIDSQKQTHDALVKKLIKAHETIEGLKADIEQLGEMANVYTKNMTGNVCASCKCGKKKGEK